jgi:hypothetical protein
MSIETLPLTDLGSAAAKMVEMLAESRQVIHAPGIYFGLDESEYHRDPALGSTNKKALLGDPSAYWWNSPLNPTREEREETPAQIRGHAVHKFVLEGRGAFERAYGRCEHKGNVKAGIADRQNLVALGKKPLAGKDYDRFEMAGSVIRLNPHIADAFAGGASEVSIFWEEKIDSEVVRQKARFDYLKRRAISDLKTHEPYEGVSFEASCHRAMKRYQYSLQAQSYLSARMLIPQFLADGMVYGDHDPDWLKNVAGADLSDIAFVFCFWASKGAPLTWAAYMSPGSLILEDAQRDIDRALQRFVDFRREFGEDTAWIKPQPLAEFDYEKINNWWLIDAA